MGSPGGFLWPLSEALGAQQGPAAPSPSAPVPRSQPPGPELGMEGPGLSLWEPSGREEGSGKNNPWASSSPLWLPAIYSPSRGEEAGTGRLGAGFDPFTTRRIFPPFLPGRTLGRGLWWAPAPELPAAPWVGVGGEAAGENSQPHSCAGGQRDSEAKISAADPEIPAGFCKEEEGGEEVAGASLSCRRRGVNPGQGSEGGSRWQGGHGGVPAAGLGRQGLMGGSSSSSSSI